MRQRLLERFDANGDGKLDGAERRAVREALEVRREAIRRKILERFDADGDGALSGEEKAAAKAALRSRLLERFDADGDGRLDRLERVRAKRFWHRLRRLAPARGGGNAAGAPVTPGD